MLLKFYGIFSLTTICLRASFRSEYKQIINLQLSKLLCYTMMKHRIQHFYRTWLFVISPFNRPLCILSHQSHLAESAIQHWRQQTLSTNIATCSIKQETLAEEYQLVISVQLSPVLISYVLSHSAHFHFMHIPCPPLWHFVSPRTHDTIKAENMPRLVKRLFTEWHPLCLWTYFYWSCYVWFTIETSPRDRCVRYCTTWWSAMQRFSGEHHGVRCMSAVISSTNTLHVGLL